MARDHACWSDPDLARKVARKRFGSVIQSSQLGLTQMMQAHAQEAQRWILGRTRDTGDTTETDPK